MIAIYTRQSKDKKDSLSIETQIEKCAAICGIKNKPYQVYTDKGFSGKNTERPGYLLMLNDIRKGLIDEVIVYQLSRISRNLNDFTNMVVEFQKYNVTVASAVESFDNSTPMGRAMINLLMVFAQLEREQTGERIKDNVMYRAGQGRFLGGTTPYGFDSIRVPDGNKTKPTLVPNVTEARIVRDIFNWYLDDMPLRAIAHKLNALGIYTKNSKRWSAARISIMLKSLYYCKNEPSIYDYFENSEFILLNSLEAFNGNSAMNYYKKRINDKDQYVIVSEHQPIIDATIWIATQNKFTNNPKINRANTAKKNLLNGLIKCSYCNKSMNMHGGKYTYFKCKTREDFGPTACVQKGIRADKLEQDVIEKLLLICSDENKIKSVLIKPKKIISLPNELALLNNNLKIKNNEIAKILSFLKSSDSPRVNEIVNKELTQLADEIADLENEINIQKLQRINSDNRKINVGYFKSFPMKFESADFETRKKLIREIVEAIRIKENGVDIKFYRI